jgi:hypothetical protein
MVKKNYKLILRLFLDNVPIHGVQGLEVKSHDFHIPILKWVGREVVIYCEPYKVSSLAVYFYIQRKGDPSILERVEVKIVRVEERDTTSY